MTRQLARQYVIVCFACIAGGCLGAVVLGAFSYLCDLICPDYVYVPYTLTICMGFPILFGIVGLNIALLAFLAWGLVHLAKRTLAYMTRKTGTVRPQPGQQEGERPNQSLRH